MRQLIASVTEPGASELVTTQRHPGQGRFSLSRLGAMTFLIVCTLYFILPFFWLIVSASKTGQELVTTFGFWFAPHFHLFTNLQFLQ